MKRNLAPIPSQLLISHDGVHDLITQLVAPSVFYQVLSRDISISKREGTEISVIKFFLNPAVATTRDDSDIEVIEFSKYLQRFTRASDLSTRISNREFLTLIKSELHTYGKLNERLALMWGGRGSTLSYSEISHSGEEDLTQFLAKIHRTKCN
jgi:hypothetical protein